MQAQSIWAGHDYAWYANRPKGSNFIRHGVRRVTAIKVLKRKDYGMERASTYVVVQDHEAGREREVRARDILSFWEDYEVQLHEVMGREEREKARKKEEEAARLAVIDTAVEILVAAGVPLNAIERPYSGSYRLTINAKEVVLSEESRSSHPLR